jgi:hypothetical protein
VTATAEPDALAELRTTGETLPAALRNRILSLGRTVVPDLIELLRDESTWLEDAPGEGWPPIHTVDLLVDLKATEAIAPMISAVLACDWDDILFSHLVVGLPKLGSDVLEPALEALEGDVSEAASEGLCDAIAKLGVRDERVFRHLRGLFERNPDLAAGFLAEYGDERAVPLLAAAIRDFQPRWERELGLFGLGDLVDAYQELSGPLPPELEQHVSELRDRWKATSAAQAASEPAPTPIKIGRNDPCPCGSGKKYKKCCW